MSWIKSLGNVVSPAFLAAVALVAIQVGMGILFKAVQTGGEYTFSISASITISEFFKFCLSSLFFYQACWARHQQEGNPYHVVPEKEPLSGEEDLVVDGSSNTNSESAGPSDDKDFSRISFDQIEQPQWASKPFTPIIYFRYCRSELNRQTVYGYGHLALLYAAINNTVFVLFKLADPGTIQLIKSGITFITALVLMLALGTKVSKVQWIAIGLQICGLIVTQYHPGTGTTYPIPTYGILLFQTFVAAVAGVCNQNLLKSQDSSMHAQNMVLYAFGVSINFIIHQVICVIKPHEPRMFEGFNHIGAILVIVSSVLNGLAITAVYKYADAIVKCFATAFSTAILLYVSPLLFNANFSFLVIPGTAVVFTATWLYMDAAPPKKQSPEQRGNAGNTPERTRSTMSKIALAFTPRGVLAIFGLLIATVIAISGIAGLNMWDTHGATGHHDSDALAQTVASSPFANTIAYIRYQNPKRIDRFPLLAKYEPFFHTVHNSIPEVMPQDADGKTFFNATLDTYDESNTPHVGVARLMESFMNDSTVHGVLFYHFDAWIRPFEFASMDFDRMWFPDSPDPIYRCFTDPEVGKDWFSWAVHNVGQDMPPALARVDTSRYKFDVRQICQGWADIYFIPRRFFRDFIYLSDTINVFHEAAIPTLLNIIDTTYRNETEGSLIQRIGDCWGSCCAEHPTPVDVEFRRCGHKLDYRNETVTQLVYDNLDSQALLIANQTQLAQSSPSFQMIRRSVINEILRS